MDEFEVNCTDDFKIIHTDDFEVIHIPILQTKYIFITLYLIFINGSITKFRNHTFIQEQIPNINLHLNK